MYPYLSDIFKDLFGIELPFPIYSFGGMVAVAVVVAAWLLGRELDRMHRANLVPSVTVSNREKGKEKRKRANAPVRVSPSALVGVVTAIAILSGFAGARLFHILENTDQFVRDPAGMLFTSGGFSFYGGLIVAGATLAWYVRKKGIPVWRFADAIAPSMMISYGIGRIGCHLAGDGDWGIMANMALKPDWLPKWLWAETYPRNILGEHIPEPGVYPTSIYEFVMAAVLFAILWAVRKHPFKAGWLFSLYLIFAGVERFLIEQIRVNNKGELFGIVATQAEVISVILILIGITGMVLTRKRATTASA